MNAYLPSDVRALPAVGAVLAAVVAVGFVLNRGGGRRMQRLLAWLIVAGAAVSVERLSADEPAGFRMLVLIAALLYGMKGVVAVESRRAGKPPLRPTAWLAFCLLWFGMRPAAFAGLPGPPRDSHGLPASGARTLLLGIATIAGARFLAASQGVSGLNAPAGYLALAVLMVGLSLTVHFGLFDLLAGAFRRLGADCSKLFRAPLRSRNLPEFWGRRWNVAFSEMTALAVFRPARGWLGPELAKFAAFLFSGLLHELAISVPVKAGYGMPFGYFLLHALAMRLEATAIVSRALHIRPLAHLWTAAWILVPLPLLFHRPFCEGVLLPLL